MGGRYRNSHNWLFGAVFAIALPALASPSHAATGAQQYKKNKKEKKKENKYSRKH